MIYILKFLHKLKQSPNQLHESQWILAAVRERRTWESGEEGDAMGGVVDLTLVPARGGGGFGPGGVVSTTGPCGV